MQNLDEYSGRLVLRPLIASKVNFLVYSTIDVRITKQSQKQPGSMSSEITDCVSFIVRKVFWSLSVASIFIGKRILDVLGLLFFVLACLTLIRFPCMLRQIPHLTFNSWRYIGLLQFLIFIFHPIQSFTILFDTLPKNS